MEFPRVSFKEKQNEITLTNILNSLFKQILLCTIDNYIKI